MNEAVEYCTGNEWQKNRYSYMASWNEENGIQSFGRAKKNGSIYKHIIDLSKVSETYNLLNSSKIRDEVYSRFETKAGDLNRVLTNTVASQPCCFNLFAPLKFSSKMELASDLFSHLLGKEALVTDIHIEFTPTTSESIGDQSTNGGTDADVAVEYTCMDGAKGIVLIEFKYIENEFSVCSSYRKKLNIRKFCDSKQFHCDKFQIKPSNIPKNPDCGYLKYHNWQLTEKSEVFDLTAIRKLSSCPYRFSLNQLWRNMLLAEKVSFVRDLDEFHFWILYPAQNTYLMNDNNQSVETLFRDILTQQGKDCFKLLHLDSEFVQPLELLAKNEENIDLLKAFRQKYLLGV